MTAIYRADHTDAFQFKSQYRTNPVVNSVEKDRMFQSSTIFLELHGIIIYKIEYREAQSKLTEESWESDALIVTVSDVYGNPTLYTIQDTEWLVRDKFAPGGYKVVTDENVLAGNF